MYFTKVCVTNCKDLRWWWKLIILSEELVKLTESSWAWRMKDGRNWLTWKDPDAGKDWRQDEMVGWHQLNGHGFGWTPGVGDGQGGLACCGSWGRKELDATELKQGNAFLPKWTKAGRCGSTYLMETSGDSSVRRCQGKSVVMRWKGLTAEGLDDLYMLPTRYVILFYYQNIRIFLDIISSLQWFWKWRLHW